MSLLQPACAAVANLNKRKKTAAAVGEAAPVVAKSAAVGEAAAVQLLQQ